MGFLSQFDRGRHWSLEKWSHIWGYSHRKWLTWLPLTCFLHGTPRPWHQYLTNRELWTEKVAERLPLHSNTNTSNSQDLQWGKTGTRTGRVSIEAGQEPKHLSCPWRVSCSHLHKVRPGVPWVRTESVCTSPRSKSSSQWSDLGYPRWGLSQCVHPRDPSLPPSGQTWDTLGEDWVNVYIPEIQVFLPVGMTQKVKPTVALKSGTQCSCLFFLISSRVSFVFLG